MMTRKGASSNQISKAELKRREQQRAALLLWLKLMTIAIVVGGGIYAATVALMDPTLLPLKVVRTDGKFRYMQREDLQQAIGGLTRGGFLTVDVAAIRDRAKSLPWVDQVSVRRVWPDSLQLWVDEHVPLTRWGEDGVLNVRGEVFHPKPESIPVGLPRLAGPDGSEKEMSRTYIKLKIRLASLGLNITAMVMDERRAWTVKLNNELVVRLGSKDLEDRLARFYSIYPLLKEDKRGLKAIDMRYTNGVAVTWKKSVPTVGQGQMFKSLRGLV
jgi:cell division protein FtsQ